MKPSSIVVLAVVALCAAQSFAETHTVTFRRMNGTVLSKVEVAHGGSVAAPTAPTVSGYTFSRWDHGDWLGCVTNNVTCWALYEWTDTSKTPSNSTNMDSKQLAVREQPYTLDEYFQMYDNLAWTDEFSGTNLKSGFYRRREWHPDIELSKDLEANRIVENGLLKLRVQRQAYTNSSWSGNGKVYHFTSGEITTEGKVTFKRGRIEIRAKLNYARGTWPSFWTMNTGSGYNEIDVFEQLSGSDWILGTLHAGPSEPVRTASSSRAFPEDGVRFSEGFHRIGAIVTERELVWYVDDHIFKRLDLGNDPWNATPTTAKHLLLCSGLATGDWLSSLGPELRCTGEADIPDDFMVDDYEIDYLRVYTNTNENNTVAYAAAPATAKLSGPVRASVWTGYDLSDYLSNANSINLWGTNGYGYDNVNFYIRTAIGQYFEREKADVVVFLRMPSDSDHEKKCAFEIPGVSAGFIDTTYTATRQNSEGKTEMYATNPERRSGVLFNAERFAPSEAGFGALDLLDAGVAFTNVYAICADLKEKSTGARVKVVGVNVVTTNGIEDASSDVALAFGTLFSKLNEMEENGDKVIVVFHSMTWACYSYAKTLANNGIGANYDWLGQNGSWPAYQHVYVSKNRQSASVSIPDKIVIPKKNLVSSYDHKPATALVTAAFDEMPPEPGDGYADEFVVSDYAKALNVTVTGYSGTPLANFPALVRLSTAIPGFSYSDFRLPNGGDLRFTDASGNLIPHEVDTWNPDGVSTVWVKLLTLEANARVIAFYGCDAPVRPLAEKVWDGDYVGVWHLGESALPLRESSGNSTDFTHQSGTGVGFAAGGIVGGAVDFPASGITNTLVALDHASLDGFTKFTIEAWTKQTAHKDVGGILSKRESYNRESAYYFYDKAGKTMLRASTNGTDSVECISTIQAPVNQWNHQVYSFDTTSSSSNIKGYLNGGSAGSVSKAFGKIFAGRGNLHLGNLGSNVADQTFNGQIDEVRISKCVRSAEWIKATYDTVTDANFLTCAMATTPYSTTYGQLDMSAFAKKVGVTFTGYSGTALADFPVLVRLSPAIDGFSYSDFRIAGGGDLRFADANGTLLPHEIDTWNPSGESTVWVKVPSLTANAKITACYGCSNPPLVAAKDVWDDDYLGVWHLGAASGESVQPDSTRNKKNFAVNANNSDGVASGADGVVGRSAATGLRTDGKGCFSHTDENQFFAGRSAFTVETWTWQDDHEPAENPDLRYVLAHSGTTETSYDWRIYENNKGKLVMQFYSLGSLSADKAKIFADDSATRPARAAWNHTAFAWDGSSGQLGLYLGGAPLTLASSVLANNWTGAMAGEKSGFNLGNHRYDNTKSFKGQIDEVRISKVARSAAWIKATHDTIANADFATYALESGEQPPEPQYDFAKEIDVTFSGYSGTALANFPVLVRLSTAIPGFSYSDFTLADGGDLRFFDAAGNLLSHEIDTWDPSGVSTVWVKVPTLSANASIVACYGVTGTPPSVDPKDVWDDNYVGVWHLGESALPMAESTGVSTPFATKTGTASYGVSGVVGSSVDFTAAKGTESFLTAADDDDLDGFNDFTVEMWTCQGSFYNANEAWVGTLVKRNARADNESWFTYQDKATRKPGLAYGNDATASDRTLALANSLPATGAWTHQAFVRTVSTSKVVMFMDGTNNSTTVKSSGAVFAGSAPLMLGGGGGQKSFPGKIDEVRISKVARSAAWIKATHDTVMNADFATYAMSGGGTAAGYAAWIAGKGITGAAAASDKVTNGIANGVRYAFDIDPATSEIGTPILKVVRDTGGNPAVQSRDLATGRDDVTFGILATPDLTDWSNATLVPMKKFAADGLWRPTASESAGYVFPSQMFFKYKVEVK